jgi:multidrug efflux pump subunit AcrA (membrane-fusion protein)
LAERQERLKLRNIVSPINGVVVDVYRLKGDLVRQEKIARLAQIDPLFVETVLPARRFGQIKVGNSHDVVPELGGGRVKATVINVDKVIDAASSTFRVRLSLPNPKLSIPPGQRCQIQF